MSVWHIWLDPSVGILWYEYYKILYRVYGLNYNIKYKPPPTSHPKKKKKASKKFTSQNLIKWPDYFCTPTTWIVCSICKENWCKWPKISVIIYKQPPVTKIWARCLWLLDVTPNIKYTHAYYVTRKLRWSSTNLLNIDRSISCPS